MALLLDKNGIALAVTFGVIIYFFGGPQYLALMLFFFAVAIIATKYQHYEKRDMGIYEHERSWENVLSNGLVPAILAVASPVVGPMPYISSVSAVMADKFASELGVLSKNPVSLENFKQVKPGKSGAVSLLGFLMSLAGGTLIGAVSIWLFGIDPNAALYVGLIGLTGSVVDSIIGVFEERGIGSKGITNIICSMVGGLLGYLYLR